MELYVVQFIIALTELILTRLSSCLIQRAGDSAEAARIEYDIEDMVEAGKQILALQVNKVVTCKDEIRSIMTYDI